MKIGAINPFSPLPAVKPAAPVSRIRHDGRPTASTGGAKSSIGQRRRDPIKAATDPAAAASSATRAALDELHLGG